MEDSARSCRGRGALIFLRHAGVNHFLAGTDPSVYDIVESCMALKLRCGIEVSTSAILGATAVFSSAAPMAVAGRAPAD
jgi:hypothetical protein